MVLQPFFLWVKESVSMNNLVSVDHSALKTNQAAIILLILAGFIANQFWLVGLVCLVMLVGSLVLKRPGFGILYTSVLKPAGLVKPDVLKDNREPHIFAQAVGGVFLLASTLSLFLGAAVLGWVLSWIVIALAALNLFAGFCVGCAMYYWLTQLKVPGFTRAAPTGTFPGMRPGRN
jgi:hypothetical protein